MTEPNIFVGDPLDERYLIDPDHTNVNQAVEIAPQQEKDAHDVGGSLKSERENNLGR